MSITKMNSYDLRGEKLSFADWVSNISPTETPFVSMTGKEAISQTLFQWQTDVIPAVKATNAEIEGAIAAPEKPEGTKVLKNWTQIFRRAAAVSDTANVVAYYGRQKEIGYQMEKAGAELKRDMEVALLTQGTGNVATSGGGGKTSGFIGQCGNVDTAQAETGAVTYFNTAANNTLEEKDIFKMTYNLYLANSKANVIMFHPKYAEVFSGLIEQNTANAALHGNRMKMFSAMDDTYNTEVDTIIDPLGQRFALVPNRFMPANVVYFFNPSDWTQMVLRAPKKIQLAKVGSSEEWVIETELGLRHRNEHASGVLKVVHN
ncbi:MAG: SU10 major capsid protein [Bacteroidales bacterium]